MQQGKFKNLETPRLLLRKLSLNDAQDYFNKLTSDPEVTKYLTYDTHTDVKQVRVHLEDLMEKYKTNSKYKWAITLKETNEFIGVISLNDYSEAYKDCNNNSLLGSTDFGYMLAKVYWGKGYATEAFKKVIDFAFNELKATRLRSGYLGNNLASGKVMEKNGFRKIGVIKNYIKKGEEYLDLVEYAITKEEWQNKNI